MFHLSEKSWKVLSQGLQFAYPRSFHKVNEQSKFSYLDNEKMDFVAYQNLYLKNEYFVCDLLETYNETSRIR